MNRVLLTGRLTRDPEMRELASGKSVTMFTVATTDYVDGAERAEYHAVVTCDTTVSTRSSIQDPGGPRPILALGCAHTAKLSCDRLAAMSIRCRLSIQDLI